MPKSHKTLKALGLFFIATSLAIPMAQSAPDREVIFQTSTINALLEGVYDGPMSFAQLQQHGDCGIGTFNALDGEMIAVDGAYYQIKSNGKVYPVDPAMKTPFAVVTFFDTDKTVTIDQPFDFSQLKDILTTMLPTKNLFYVFKIQGKFSYVKTRSVPRQTKPYPLLTEVTKQQPTFEFNNVEGTVVGFYCPSFVTGINVPGYHFHFLTKDKTAGGHILDLVITDVTVQIDTTTQLSLVLPQQESFYVVDLQKDKQQDLEQVEKGE